MKRFTVGVFVVIALHGGLIMHHSRQAPIQRSPSPLKELSKCLNGPILIHTLSWVINSKAAELWNFEMTSPALLLPNGWKATTLKAGDKVKVTARSRRAANPADFSCR